MKLSRIVIAAATIGISIMQNANAGQVQSITDHSLPKAKIRTFHARCAPDRLVIIRLDPEAKTICGSAQQEGVRPACLPRPEKNDAAAVRQVAGQLCR